MGRPVNTFQVVATTRRVQNLLEGIVRDHGVAVNSFGRYLERPDTVAGQTEHERFRAREASLVERVQTLASLFGVDVNVEFDISVPTRE